MNKITSFLRNVLKTPFSPKKAKLAVSAPKRASKGIQRIQVYDQHQADNALVPYTLEALTTRRKLVSTLVKDVLPQAAEKAKSVVLVHVTHAAPMLAFADHKQLVRQMNMRPVGLPVIQHAKDGSSATYFWALPRVS